MVTLTEHLQKNAHMFYLQNMCGSGYPPVANPRSNRPGGSTAVRTSSTKATCGQLALHWLLTGKGGREPKGRTGARSMMEDAAFLIVHMLLYPEKEA